MLLFADNAVLKSDFFKYYDEGTKAYIYKFHQLLLKYYNSDCHLRDKIFPTVFYALKELKIKHMVELCDLYYTDRMKRDDLYMYGYTMIDCGKRISSVLCQPTEYLLEMVYELETQTVVELSKARIVMVDTHFGNILFTEKGVYILDPDYFRISSLDEAKVLEINLDRLWEYLLSTFIHELYDGYNYRYLCSVFERIQYQREPTLTLKLKRFFDGKTPMESIKKKNLL